MPALSRSAKGRVVEARKKALTRDLSSPLQAVLGGGHGHGQAVFVPVAKGTFALGNHDNGRGKPAHFLKDAHAVEAEPGNDNRRRM